jgi:hypothetical protein
MVHEFFHHSLQTYKNFATSEIPFLLYVVKR